MINLYLGLLFFKGIDVFLLYTFLALYFDLNSLFLFLLLEIKLIYFWFYCLFWLLFYFLFLAYFFRLLSLRFFNGFGFSMESWVKCYMHVVLFMEMSVWFSLYFSHHYVLLRWKNLTFLRNCHSTLNLRSHDCILILRNYNFLCNFLKRRILVDSCG